MKAEYMQIVIAIGLFIAITLWAMRGSGKDQSKEYYFIGRGGMNASLVFFTLFATYFSAFTVVGLPAMYYAHGIGAFLFLGIGVLLTPLTILFFANRLVDEAKRKPEYITPIGLLTSRYGSSLLTAVVSIITVVLLVPYLILQIAGIGKFFLGLSNGDISYITGIVICCAIVGLYLYRGGAIADARTDLAQGVLMFSGALLLGGLVVYRLFTDNFDYVSALQEKELLTLPGPKEYFSWQTLLSYAVIFGLISVATPQVSSKYMGSTSREQLKPSIYLFPLAGLLVIILAGFFGLYAAARLDVASPDLVIGDVLRDMTTGEGVVGFLLSIVSILFVCGIVSAAVSTIDSLLLSIAAIFSENIGKDNSDETRTYKLWMAGLLALSFFLAFEPPKFIADLAKLQVGGLMALLPCLLAPLFGVSNAKAAWLSVIAGCAPLVLVRVSDITFFGFDVGLANLIFGIFGLVIGLLVFNNKSQDTAPA